MYVWMYVCKSSLQRWWIRLLVGFTDPYNHTYSESLWWKLFKNHQKTQIQRQRQWQRQRQRQRHRKSAWNTQLMLYFWNPDNSLIPNMMIDTSPWSSCSRRSPWLPCSSHKICFGPPTAESKNLKNHVNFDVGDLFFRSPALWSSQNVFGPPTAGRAVVDIKDREVDGPGSPLSSRLRWKWCRGQLGGWWPAWGKGATHRTHNPTKSQSSSKWYMVYGWLVRTVLISAKNLLISGAVSDVNGK